MRCLYCGKELALLKRLTGGAEFCSEAHRKSYQSEYNDLALSRLLQAKQVADPLPALKGDDKSPATTHTPKSAPALEGSGTPSNVVAVPLSVPAGSIPEGSMMAVQAVVVPPGAEKPAVGSAVGFAVSSPDIAVAYADDVQTMPAPPEPQPQEIVTAMWGPLVEQPVAAAPAPIAIASAEPAMESTLTPELPANLKDLQSLARDYNLLWANPVTWTPPISGGAGSFQPRQRNVEVRDFQRGNASPWTPRYPSPDAVQTDFKNSAGDAMEITNQPRPPAAPPQIWHVPPQSHASVELVLGALGVNDFAATGFDREVPHEDATVQAPRPQAPPPVIAQEIAAEPIAIAPTPTPVAEAVAARTNAPADPVLQPLPIAMDAIAADKAAVPASGGNALSTVVEPRVPASNALPMRPVMVLGPAPAKPEPKPEQPTAAKVIETPAPSARVLRSSGKKRADVRVIPTAPTPVPAQKPKQVAVAQPAVAAQAPTIITQPTLVAPAHSVPAPQHQDNAPTPVMVVPAGVSVVIASSEPVPVPTAGEQIVALVNTTEAIAAPAPQAKAASSRSTLVPSEPVAAPRVTAAPAPPTADIDLKLPELHLQEMQQGMWARMPNAVKLAIAAMIVLGVSGFAYMAMNSTPASATTTAPKALNYRVGAQINSGGWIEDWAPNDSLRRVTLLRGSMPFSDYRIEFNAQIQRKAIGWMYRGLNPKNYYVAKIEKLTSGLEPKVVFARYAVIDGKNEGRVEIPLPIKVRVDTTYKVRFDAVGPSFTVWVQGQQVAQWKDTRLGSGGLGLYAEGDEAAAVQGNVDVFELNSTK